MKRIVLALSAFFAATASAHAGYKVSYPLVIDVDGLGASGALGTIRNAPGAASDMSCEVFEISDPLMPSAYGPTSVMACRIKVPPMPERSYPGFEAFCESKHPSLTKTAQAIKGDSLIILKWDASGQCTDLTVTNSSWTEPKQ